MKRYLWAASAATFTLGMMTVVGTGVASAKSHSNAPVALGSTVCNFHGSLTAPVAGLTSLSGNITPQHKAKACSSTGGTALHTGHLVKNTLVSATSSVGVCALLAGGSLPDVSQGVIKWSPKPKVAATNGLALGAGTVSIVTVGTDSYLQIAYASGSVSSGSFTNASGASFSATSNDDVATLTSDCAGGTVDSIAIHGSLTL